MFPQPPAHTAGQTLDQVLAQLRACPDVDGLLLIGSTARHALTPVSDYDLLIILDTLPETVQVGVTTVDGRLTDLLFGSAADVAAILAAEAPIDGEAWVGRIARWLLSGEIAYDRRGQLGAAQAKVQGGGWVRPLELIDGYGAWIGVNYNLLHTRRLLQSDDPVYRAAGELRISVYGIPSVLFSYFQVRQLRWEGDKAAIRYLSEHDPQALALLQRMLGEPDAAQRMEAYEQLAAHTLAPIGGLWGAVPTVLWSDGAPLSWESIAASQALWERLLQAA